MQIKILDIKKTYKGITGPSLNALDGISYTFPSKGVVFILGPSGCGKTTLLNILSGLDTVTDGDVLINGESTKKYTSQKWNKYRTDKVGIVFQNYNLLEEDTVYNNVELALELQHQNNKIDLVKESLEKVGLNVDSKRKVRQLSGGQKQRVAIARALVKNPDLIIADEPTGNLDSKTSRDILEVFKGISKDRLVILVSHNEKLATEYADEIIRMQDGKIVETTKKDNSLEKIEEQENKKEKAKGLSIKKVAQYSFKYFLKNAFRYVVAILLFVLMAVLSQTGEIASRYDKYEVAYRTILNSGIKEIEIAEDSQYLKNENGEFELFDYRKNNSFGYRYSTLVRQNISSDLSFANSIKKVFPTNANMYLNGQIYENTKEYNNGFIKYYAQVDEIDYKNNTILGYTILGTLPKEKNQVAITKKIAKIIYDEKKDIYGINSYTELIGKGIAMPSYWGGWPDKYGIKSTSVDTLYITCIVDTEIDENIEVTKKTIKKDENYNSNIGFFEEKENEKYIHNTIFVTSEFIKNYNKEILAFIVQDEISTGFGVNDARIFKEYYDESLMSNYYNFELISPYRNNYELKTNEIYINLDACISTSNLEGWQLSDSNLYSIYRYNLDQNHEKDLEDYIEDLNKDIENNHFLLKGFGYLNIPDSLSKYKTCPEIINKDYASEDIELEIVGFYRICNVTSGKYVSSQSILVSQDFFDTYTPKRYTESAILINLEQESKENAIKLLKYLDNSDEYKLNHLYANDLEIADNRAEILKDMGDKSSIVFLIIAILIMLSSVLSIIDKSTRDLGVFRALGSSKSKIMLIYILQGMMVFVIAYILSIVALPIVTSYLEGAGDIGILTPIFKNASTYESLSSSYSIKLIDILKIEMKDYLEMGLFSFITIMLSTIIPTFIKLNKKPVSLLRRQA